MSILDFLKKIKLPRFEDDFIQVHAEKTIEEAPVSYGGTVVYDPRQDPITKAARDDLHEWMEEQEKERHNSPGDPQYIPSASEEW